MERVPTGFWQGEVAAVVWREEYVSAEDSILSTTSVFGGLGRDAFHPRPQFAACGAHSCTLVREAAMAPPLETEALLREFFGFFRSVDVDDPHNLTPAMPL